MGMVTTIFQKISFAQAPMNVLTPVNLLAIGQNAGAPTFLANTLRQGDCISLHAFGSLATGPRGGTLSMVLKWGNAAIGQTLPLLNLAMRPNDQWEFDARITILSNGGRGVWQGSFSCPGHGIFLVPIVIFVPQQQAQIPNPPEVFQFMVGIGANQTLGLFSQVNENTTRITMEHCSILYQQGPGAAAIPGMIPGTAQPLPARPKP